ncbi:cell division protein FtsI/penicillin-binding protein 2 [Fervidobacterium pennivorans DSM 9078]|jgi:penicillin-binding protein 2|uniref:Cell division protein FtsI/penicillin-binding protein 2 n=2 Tax=Fervidobacterium pennivorans TaxID=93466 RepID=H9UDA8_FERPD|nr:cell division protein FtsI/penicillin-binding protein 2 [Fervidobacterium pennivorans DSM 9078]
MRRYIPFFIFFAMFFYVIFGLVKVQIIDRPKHVALLNSLLARSFYNRGLRGTIYSSDGVKLAWSERIPTLVLKKYTAEDEKQLRKYIDDSQIAVLKNSGSVEVTWEQAFVLQSKGYQIVPIEKRKSYSFLYHIVGSVNKDGEGIAGLEYVYNEVLKGKLSVSYGIRSPSGKYSQDILENLGENGLDLQTTINFKLQKYAYDLLTELATPSVIIVSDVRTGDILAMVSYPSPDVDLNEVDTLTWEKLVNDPLKPLLNRAISNVYPPGSAFKAITAIAQMLYGHPSTLSCSGVFHYRDSKGRITATYKDWFITGHGVVDLKKAIRVSCNVYFYNAALEVGIDKLVNVAKAFYLDQKTGINLPGEVAGTLPSPEWKLERFGEKWYPGDTVLFGIGQGFLDFTPIQILSLYNTIANKGIFVKPRLVLNEEILTKKVALDIPEPVWDTLIDGLEQVTTVQGPASSGGTAAKSFEGFKITVAGKTGTAQTHSGPPHAWFVGFAPSRNPKYSVAVLVENGGSGGQTAAPVARKVFDFMLENGFFDEEENEK